MDERNKFYTYIVTTQEKHQEEYGEDTRFMGMETTLGNFHKGAKYGGTLELYAKINTLKFLIEPLEDSVSKSYKGRMKTSFWVYSNDQLRSLKNSA